MRKAKTWPLRVRSNNQGHKANQREVSLLPNSARGENRSAMDHCLPFWWKTQSPSWMTHMSKQFHDVLLWKWPLACQAGRQAFLLGMRFFFFFFPLAPLPRTAQTRILPKIQLSDASLNRRGCVGLEQLLNTMWQEEERQSLSCSRPWCLLRSKLTFQIPLWLAWAVPWLLCLSPSWSNLEWPQ